MVSGYVQLLLNKLEGLHCHGYFLSFDSKFLMFDGQFYLQATGASMGAKFSPSLANIYMAWWERDNIFDFENPFLIL